MKKLLLVLVVVSNVSFGETGRNTSVSFHPCHSNEIAIVGTPTMISEGTFYVPSQCVPATCYFYEIGSFLSGHKTWTIIRKENQRVYKFETAPGDSDYQKQLRGLKREWRVLAEGVAGRTNAENRAHEFMKQGLCTKAEESSGLHSGF